MVYKYQEETIKELKKAIENIEAMTEEHYRLDIGYRSENGGYDRLTWTIFLEINGTGYFTECSDDIYPDVYPTIELEYCENISFNKDLFLDLNKLIDSIIKDNKKRKEFHEKLNNELKALNEAL